ncbi:MAG: cytidylate kinase-like family protein [Selenomonas sp.]|nr:cytidylate kinase-like family protein [Selenomonas sp.]
MKNNTVITISREYGSGGRELSQILAKKLGVKLYDRQIISKAAAEVGVEDMDFDKLKKFEEEVPPLPVKFMPFYLFGVSAGPQTLNDKLFDSECEIIKRLADSGSCVILGRCADYVLRDRENTYSFFICADDKFREERGRTVYEDKSLSELENEDLKRGGYYSHYTGRKWGNPKYYDLAINTGRVGLEQAADMIIRYIEEK